MVGIHKEASKGLSFKDLQNKIPLTVDRLVQRKRFGRHAEIVVLKFELFKEKEDEARQLFNVYVSAIQAGNDQFAREIDTKFLTLTHFSAVDINAKRQERWVELREKVHGTS